MRTQDEIVARYDAVKDGDFMGFRAEVLLVRLDWEHVSKYLKPTAERGDWDETKEGTDDEHVSLELAGYLDFAWGKARDHRGISAERSVQKLTDLVWLLGRDDVLEQIDAAGYAQYGAPKLKVISEAFGLPMPDSPDIVRMMAGLECDPTGCESGCGG